MFGSRSRSPSGFQPVVEPCAWQPALRVCLLAFSLSAASPLWAAAAGTVDFNHDIRPILAENCFKCHGPDPGARKSELRLDVREEALKPAKSGAHAIVPEAPPSSELLARVKSTNVDYRMPPAQTGKKLTATQIDLLERWIKQGAGYAKHWAYVKPERPPVPEVDDAAWVQNPIDNFILARLRKQALKPSPAANRYVLARRASLDLLGLPPELSEVDAFLADERPGAFGFYVDRLLAKPAFGEHWARLWLDLARYADSAGYADDPFRTIWLYRDYVIKSFNQNKPFDQFTVEQLAGDLLADPSEEELEGTGFHRNTMTNNEGGTDDEEFRNAAVVDRVNTTMAVWMATSMACAQCHSHKYDPISQQEYFRFFAIFNNTQDADRPDESPLLEVFSAKQKSRRVELTNEVQELRTKFESDTPENRATLAAWEKFFPPQLLWAQVLGRSTPVITDEDLQLQYLGVPEEIINVLTIPNSKRNLSQWKLALAFFRGNLDPQLKTDQQRFAEAKKQLAEMKPDTIPVMRELAADKRRSTHVQLRGNFKALAEEVTPGIPEVFQIPGEPMPTNRIQLAKWLVNENNPLTARVVVNRFWEQIFGIGIVRTSEDFGTQGETPSHPELLDWMATEFVARKWDVKSFLKLLVTSATYQQSSTVTPELRERDPENLLLARGPRFRLQAEAVRDQALNVAGLLSDKMFGPSVRPPRPASGLSAAFGSALDYKASEGEDRYRRGLYIELRRTSVYPSLASFDAPSREVCALKRPRSNTPLQALVTLNDPVYMEAAQALARRIVLIEGSAPEKANAAFRMCLARPPSPNELQRIASFYEEEQRRLAKEPSKAEKLATEPIGAVPEGEDVLELAAWTTVANVLLNLDEMVLKP